MKLFAYFALFGLASTQELPPMGLDFEDDELDELLDISISRWGERRLEQKGRVVEKAKEYFSRPARETIEEW